jgi:Xaa-Pro aminopeptidase/Xaa-Pro dipeptidase
LHGTAGKYGQIGVDIAEGSSVLLTALEKYLRGFALTGCDAWIQRLRMVKTPQERVLLTDIASRADHGILGAVHHLCVKTPMSEKRLAEEVRIHCLERGLDVAGYEAFSQVASGPHAQKFWPLAPKYGAGWDRVPRMGELVRVEMRATLEGYWCDAARMVVMGQPSEAQQQTYDGLIALRKAALRYLRPGAKCAEVFRAMEKEAKLRGIELIGESGVGHGVGVSPHEPPFLTSNNETELSVGMVLVLDPVIYGPNREVVRSKDTVTVTQAGCQLVGWYKNWDAPYVTAYTF